MKYSVILPIYNAEKTLAGCLESLSAQSFPDAEFLLIDDGSTDASAGICREFAARDPRFRLISKENGGVSAARNLGLDQAQGEFILFVDSDDSVMPGYFETLDAIDPEGRYDYLLFSYRRSDGSVRALEPFASTDPAEYEPVLARAYRTKRINAPWNKRFRRSILTDHQLRFHGQLPIAEDALFNLQYLTYCRGLCMSDAVLYCVSLENPHSLSRRPLENRRELLALADRESLKAIENAPVSEELRAMLQQSRNHLLLRDIYSEGKQLHLAALPLAERWRILSQLCRGFNQRRADLPGDLHSRLLALPVRLGAVPVIDLLGRRLSRK